MDLSIVIVNWNTRELLKKCLTSIYQNTANLELEVIVIDNNSVDGSREMIEKEFPQVKLIVNKKNKGYVFANNQGMGRAEGDFILLLNSDTEVLPGSLEKMVRFMRENSKVGIGGCQLLNSDQSLQLSVRCFPTLRDQIIVLTKLHNFWPQLIKKYLCLDFDYTQQQPVDQLQGAFMMTRREVVAKIGALDENIWAWFEDVDYCQRVKQAGWQVVYTPVAQIIHHKGRSFNQQLAFKKQKILVKSLLYYFKKHHGLLSYLILLPFAVWSLILAGGVQIFKIKKINKQL